MTANINPETGIAYGYVSANALDSEVVQNLMYGSQATNETANELFVQWLEDEENYGKDECEFWDQYEDYEPSISGTYEDVSYCSSWLGGALNFFIVNSPHVTECARLASPCVPNAGILDTLDGNVTSYNVPPNWRRMDVKTLEALKGSIDKWQQIVDGKLSDNGPSNCPLCRMFHSAYSNRGECCGCPVSEHTEMWCCNGTPYEAWDDHFSAEMDHCREANTPERIRLATAELEFLKSLLPKVE